MRPDEIVEGMPKVEVPSGIGLCTQYRDAQCLLLAEGGYRPVPSVDWLRLHIPIARSERTARAFRQRLLGDKE